jgi:hypothetical protein
MSAMPILAALRRPLALWLAVLIALFGAVAPTVSHAIALQRGDGAGWTEVCTLSGPRWIALHISTDSPDGQESAPAAEHCPFCLLFTYRVLPAPHSLVHLFFVSGEPQAPTVRQAFFFFTHFALAPPPRGPPACS